MVVQQFFKIPGDPIPKGRPRTQRPGAIARRPYTPRRTVDFEARVKDCAAAFQIQKIVGPVELLIIARWAWPQSYRRKRTKLREAFKSTGADADNVAKAIQDALNGIAFEDDRQVARLVVEKRFTAQDSLSETLVWISSLEGRAPTPVRTQ
jgi:Holliday junction resolvase RusA-like endonuclease